MALVSKDIKTFTGGISNAIDPVDKEGDKDGVFKMVNVDGVTKEGVLRPCGTMVPYATPLEDFDMTNTPYGSGFEIMSLDYDLGTTVIWQSSDGEVLTSVTENGDGNMSSSTATKLRWDFSTTGSTVLEWDSTNAPTLEDSTWYSYEFKYNKNEALLNAEYAWITGLDSTAVDNLLTDSWNEPGVPFHDDTNGGVLRGIFKSKASAGKDFGLQLYASVGQGSGYVEIQDIIITKLPMPGSHEVQFLQEGDGSNTHIHVFQDGSDGTTIGTPIRTINMGTAAEMADIHYLKGSNTMRISDGNFNNDTPTKFFGYIDRTFFKDCSLSSTSIHAHLVDSTVRNYGIKRKHWIEEDAALVSPNPAYCVVPCLGDIHSYTDSSLGNNAETSTLYWHRDLNESLSDATDGYLLRLEYAVIKETNLDQSGNWNPSDDGQDGTVVFASEKNTFYKFYCSFVYDHDSMESELTPIAQCVQQGNYIDDGGYIADGYKNYSDKIQLMYHDMSTAYPLSGQLEVHAGPMDPHLAWDCAVAFKPTIQTSGSGKGGWNLPERCTGVNWYYAKSKDGYNKKYRLIQTDFRDGVKYHSADSESFLPWTITPIFQQHLGTDATNTTGVMKYFYSNDATRDGGWSTMEDPPEGEDWDTIYGIKSEGWSDLKYKSSVVIGGQAYYGHVMVDNEVHRDRVLVSIGNHGYDMIPDDNYLEVVAGDGDEIVHLLTHNSQLYVFKRNKLVVCDIGGEKSDKVVAEHLVGGITSRHQGVATNKGIFWINRYGAFLSSGGETAESLIKGRIQYEAKAHGVEGTPCVWSLLESEYPVIGYSAILDQVFILSSTIGITATPVSKAFWKYDMNDESFWYHDGNDIGAFLDGNSYTNFAIDKNNNIVIMGGNLTGAAIDSGEITLWNPSPISCPILWDAGATDLGSPSSLKQFYKLSVVSKNADANIVISAYAISNEGATPGSWESLTLVDSTALNTGSEMMITHHKIGAGTGIDVLDPSDDTDLRKAGRNAHILKTIITTGANSAPADFELNSVSMVYRDKGVKGPR